MSKRTDIKTKFLHGYKDTDYLEDGSELAMYDEPAFRLWLPQDDVTVIGFEMKLVEMLSGAGKTVPGCTATIAELSKVGKMYQDGALYFARIGFCCMHLSFAGQDTLVLEGQRDLHEAVIYPVGYGVDLDEHEPIYVNFYCQNEFSPNARHSVRVILYYVER